MSSLLKLLLLSISVVLQTTNTLSIITPKSSSKDRPLLRQFGNGINERVLNSKEGFNRFGLENHYTSDETIPCLDMQTTTTCIATNVADKSSLYDISSQSEIRDAYINNDNTQQGTTESDRIHGRSSGSGCCIIRLTGKDAASVRLLVDFADDFFDCVDCGDNEHANYDADNNGSAHKLKDLGVFRIANNVHAGFDHNVNEEDKMQVLESQRYIVLSCEFYTKLIPGDDEDPMLLPLEVGDLVGAKSLTGAHSGMGTLFDIGNQITSAVLGMDSESTNKLLDDCSHVTATAKVEMKSSNHEQIADTMSNSYQRIIRYLKPKPANEQDEETQNDEAFWPHVDSTFLTLIPLPEIAGLEVWCPSSKFAKSEDMSERGEWVRPCKPSVADSESEEDCIHVVALAGEFLQLLSDGQVSTCIHRVIAPKPSPKECGFGSSNKTYKPRVSAPLFLRPRIDKEAIFDIETDLRDSDNLGLYHETGLMEECDGMRVWDYMDCMSPNN